MTLNTASLPIRLGGNICLDFINTRDYFHCNPCTDSLTDYAKLIAWCWQSGLITEIDGERLIADADTQRSAAAAALEAALVLRDALYRILTAKIMGDSPVPPDLVLMNHALVGRRRIIQQDAAGFDWTWTQPVDLPHVIAPIAFEAALLLTSDQLQRVRQCPNCGWLFVDTSRNHSRRWCSMDICGSQVKSRRQYQRRKQNP